MVCVNYKDTDYLRDECEDGRRLGYNGKVSRTKNYDPRTSEGRFIVLFLTASNSSQSGRHYTEYICAHRERYIDFVTSFILTLMCSCGGTEIRRAAKIVAMMESSHKDKKGAFGLDMGDGKGMEMIDAPMLKQVRICLSLSILEHFY